MDVLVALEQAPQDAARSAFIEFASSRGDDALWKFGGPEHLTASCFVFSPDLREVLLTHHRKGRFWVQFGGHLDPADASLADAARREGREESGIDDLQLLSGRVMDLDRHELHGGFTCAAHWDVGFVAVASVAATIEVRRGEPGCSLVPGRSAATGCPASLSRAPHRDPRESVRLVSQ